MKFHDVTTGASNDLEEATKLARAMVTEYGMSEKLGPLVFGARQHEVFLGRDFSANPDYSPEIAFEIDKEIRRLMDEAFERARGILNQYQERLQLLATQLIAKETIEKEELTRMLDGVWKPDDEGDQTPPAEADAGAGAKAKRPRKPRLLGGERPGHLRPAENP